MIPSSKERSENAREAPKFYTTEHGTPKGRSRSRNHMTRRSQKSPDIPGRLNVCPCLSNLTSPKPGHTTGGSGRDGPWLGRNGRRRFGSPRRHLSLVPTSVPKTIVLNVSSEARTVEFVLKTDGGTKPAVDPRFISVSSARPRALLVPCC